MQYRIDFIGDRGVDILFLHDLFDRFGSIDTLGNLSQLFKYRLERFPLCQPQSDTIVA
ncbi:hypothetical protein D3C81_2335430 [compost metagenome]